MNAHTAADEPIVRPRVGRGLVQQRKPGQRYRDFPSIREPNVQRVDAARNLDGSRFEPNG